MCILAVFISILMSTTSFGQSKESEAKPDTAIASKIGWIAYPYAFYTPETQLAVGAGGIVHFKTANILGLRPSKVLLTAYYTSNNQYFMSLKPVIYLADEERKVIESNINYGKEILKFYGVGNSTPEIEILIIPCNRFSFILNLPVKHL